MKKELLEIWFELDQLVENAESAANFEICPPLLIEDLWRRLTILRDYVDTLIDESEENDD